MNFLSYFAVKYVQRLEDISKSSKYCLGYILKGQKVLNDRMKLENNSDAILNIQHSGGTGTSSCLVPHKMMNYQIDKKQTNKQAYQRPATVLFLLQLLLLVKFSLFCVAFFFGGMMGCGEQVTNWHYFIQSSFALHSLHFGLSRICLSVSLDSLFYHLLLRQSSITVHVKRSTHLLFII